jgi:hypothetical protein
MLFAADEVSTYLIMGDIPPYHRLTQAIDMISEKVKTISGYTIYSHPGILAGADHFSLDHADVTYETDYQSETIGMGATVQVTQHSGSDSDKWLLHEMEDGYRDNDLNTLGRLTEGTILRKIGTNRAFWLGLGGGSFMWLNNNVVVKVSYVDLQGTKPEPLEVVQAYLQKFPSTIPTTLVLDKAHDEQWIKDEMDRRLWLCDKWFEQLQLGKTDQKTVLQETVKSMNIFLDYREKYYGIKAMDDKNLLVGYLHKDDLASAKVKLDEYKTWWTANKSGSFIGILSIYIHKTFNHVTNFFKKVFVFLTSLLQKLFVSRL